MFCLLVWGTHYAGAQGTLTNGYTHQAVISPIGNLDAWTFSANNGDRIVIRVGKISQTNTFNPRITLINPNAVQQATDNGTFDAEIAVTATNTGTFTVNVDDVGSDATGTYRLTLAKSPGAITIAPGDEGGELTNGWKHTGMIEIGDLDEWSFTATSGDSIVVRMGCTNLVYPWVRLYGPNGALLNDGSGNYDAEAAFRATNSGTFTVVVGSFYESIGYNGDYILSLAKSPGVITVAPGDQGGALTNGFVHIGTIDIGDLDVWDFNACAGDGIILQVDELTGGASFTPEMRLYGPDGTLLNTVSGATTAQINRTAPALGSYTLIVSDTAAGSGTYQLTGAGVSTGFIMCKPLINGTNLIIRSVGGSAGSNYVLLTTTNIALPLTNWTPIRTNQFGTFGEFSVTNLFSTSVTQQYFRARSP